MWLGDVEAAYCLDGDLNKTGGSQQNGPVNRTGLPSSISSRFWRDIQSSRWQYLGLRNFIIEIRLQLYGVKSVEPL